MSAFPPIWILLLLATGGDPDSDRDGLPDFHEVHKYGTDPRKADSDGDGVPDGDWLERREYAYVVRSVVQVMRPVTPEFLDDDYQDVRVLDEGEDFVELEVIHYPFNTVASVLEGDRDWRRHVREQRRWLEAGPTSDWTPALAKEITRAFEQEEGLEVEKLDDRALAERASAWLMRRSEFHDGFTSFAMLFDDRGKPFVPPALQGVVERRSADQELSLEQLWSREISATGMFRQAVHGSCTSSAIYLSGCLRALGLPTRTVLCIPVIDASDESEWRLVQQGISHNGVRRAITAALGDSRNAWTSHTFNEVFVGGRWRRLNYSNLGQNILDAQYLGLMTHVATFHDWSDARAAVTIGVRQMASGQDDRFGHRNPYSTISLRDVFGPHCTLENPAPDEIAVTIERLEWTDSERLPDDVHESCVKRERFGLIAVIRGGESFERMQDFFERVDPALTLEGEGQAIETSLQAGCWWWKNGLAYVWVPLARQGERAPRRGVDYDVRAAPGRSGTSVTVALSVRRD
jgi:hypothetical protein